MERTKLVRTLVGLLLAWVAAGTSPASLANPHAKTLSNGLKVIVKEDHRAPVVVSQIWYRVGSMDEVNGLTGVSHVLEHMMFKGTEKVPAGEFSRIIAAAGGRENAFTSRDYTAYFQVLHKSKLPLAMRLEADRMRNLTLSEKEFEKEIKVVMEERRWRTEDKPRSLVYEQLMAVAFLAHPYRWPVIGWMNDLESMTIQDLRQWYHRWYAPNNATLVVVGDVKPEQVFKLAQRYYGKYKPIALPVRKPQDEPLQQGIRRVTVKAPAKLPYLIMGYRVVPLRDARNDWEPYALEVLAGVLDGHPAARLNRELVREARIAQSVGTGYDLLARGPSIFLLEGTPSEGRTVAELEAALREQVRRIVDEGVGEEELNRVKAQVVANQVYSRDSMFYQAMQIGQLEMVGLSYKDLDVLIQKLQAVTADQVREVAKKYLVEDRLTVAVLDPQPLDEARPALPPKGMRHAQ
ncbi:MAG: peptidase M16 [Azospira oryzae]|uniref:Insulinase family protein n=1 Tax=Pelomicrobium methylotrophicum TaxID=2602750 RepID=A0A5C7EV24_9PROT|nr:pitrilysin family protein [Pelomicrobium methylotrophicum]PZP55165.1 MAG: peptidase M16 [Azospira oryzae]PZP77760.1 MAG: peptidase M16 [Azospira oryzae]TXF10873.1 insulinase family protein [Pelomicrobium methylotrophicum]